MASLLDRWSRARFWPLLVLLAALSLTAAATLLALRAQQARLDAAVAAAVEEDVARLDVRMNAYLALLRATRAFVVAEGDRLGLGSFRAFVEGLGVQDDYRGIQGLGWSPRIDPQRVSDFEAAARRGGHAGFTVRTAGGRTPQFTILHLEPLDERNRAALGFDMSSEPVRADAMRRARDSGRFATSGRVVLVQEIGADKHAGFLVYLPVYAGGAVPEDAQDRRRDLVGFVYAPFRAPDVFGALFSDRGPAPLRAVYAAAQPDAAHLLFGAAASSSAQTLLRRVTYGGQPWTLAFERQQGAPTAGVPLVIAAAGLVLSALLFLLARAQWQGRRRSEERQALLDLVITESQEGIVVCDARGLLQIFNPAAERQHGATRQEVAAPEWARAYGLFTLGGEPLPLESSPLYRALHGETVLEAAWQVRRPDGAWRTLSGSAAPLRRADGSRAGAVLVTRDDTEQLAAQAERERLLAAAARTQELLRQQVQFAELFVGVVSHDLRNPLNVVLLNAGLLKRSGLDAGAARAVERIESSGQRALRLIRDLLDFTQARLGTGLRVTRTPGSAADIVRRVVDELRSAHPQRDIRLEVLDEGAGTWDADRLAQVLGNLVANALVYGDPRAPVTVRVSGDGDHVRLAVHNSGNPVPQDILPVLFEPLQQGGPAGSGDHNIGLGLFIVRQIATAHGGSVQCESDRARGTAFTVLLPRTPPMPGADDFRPPPPPSPAAAPAPRSPPA